MKRAALAVSLLLVAACSRKEQAPTPEPTPASPVVATVTPDAGAAEPPRELTEKEKLEAYRATLTDLATHGKYTEVCKGAPWFNQALCSWMAGLASEKPVARPDRDVFRAFFAKEHWKQVYGTVISDPNKTDDELEVSVGGYRNHCLLSTVDTKFSSRGRFDMWVAEQPETREVTLNSGATANWVVLEEEPLARLFHALGRARGAGIESTAMARDAMAMIATYQTYAELKGETPQLPDAKTSPAPSASAPPTTMASAPVLPVAQAPAVASVKAAPPMPVVAAMPKPLSTRRQCVTACVSKCADDAACERTCVAACPSP